MQQRSDGYSKLGARSKNFRKLVFSKKKVFDLVFPYFSLKIIVIAKKSLRIDLVFPTFLPNFIVIFNKNIQHNETICSIFKKGEPDVTASLTSPNIPNCNNGSRVTKLTK